MLNYDSKFETLAVRAAKAARSLIINGKTSIDREIKSVGRDIKLELDRLCHEIISEILLDTAVPIISEEQINEVRDYLDYELVWIIDPLDGSYNLKRGFPYSCISIALVEYGKPVFGCILEIDTGNFYQSSSAAAAKVNGRLIHVSPCSDPKDSVLLTGFPVHRSYKKEDLEEFVLQVQSFKKVRMIGSAARSLCLVAEGIFDIYWENEIYIWDVAAGLALVTGAGGSFSITSTKDPFKINVIAANERLLSKQTIF